MKSKIKELESFNQIAKNFNKESSYVLRNGKIYSHCMNDDKGNGCFIRMYRTDGEKILSEIDFETMILGDDLYKFIKENKKDICSFENECLSDNKGNKFYITAITNKYHKMFKRTKKAFKYFRENKCIEQDITNECIEALDRSMPILIELEDDFNLRFTKKFLKFRYNAKIENVKLKYHPFDDGLYVINIIAEKDNYIIEQLYFSIKF